ncbi:M42 family metallopeptidase [Calorimonas adulescens]|jgi:M42 glutamyl aminopeptidase.|uniref:M42 family metallopeptidase n=1 Tax=Calorimonas adulescens TaxID=2606906 RepID=A0A5D8Q9A0_9THEO|nr:M42 family metallopeptidase [Calorimonas adulescens]TZE81160.1 M42 family metallopeptidase [Calorimonas adulescens]
MKELLKRLTSAYGPSGNEEEIREVIREEIKGYVDEIRVDTLGNLIAVKRGNGSKVMLAAHMDQIGLIVTYIDDRGFLRFAPVGGLGVTDLVDRKVRFKNGTVGVVSYENEIKEIKDVTINNMYIDIGASSREDALSMVKIGDVAVYYTPFGENRGKCTSCAMDDRAACALLIETIRNLKDSPHEIYFVFTVQEELGLRGATTAAYAIEPYAAVAVDVTDTGDTPKSVPMAVKLGAGPAIKVFDNSVMVHPAMKNIMVDEAEKLGIPYQLEVLKHGGTDSGAIALSRNGVPTGALSIPCRYIHSDSEMVDISDIEKGVRLLTGMLHDGIRL